MFNTTLCYVTRGNEVLMLHRVKKKNDINHDKWIGIGGKFEQGESPEDCLLREAKEETGLTVTSYRYRGIVTFVSGDDTEYMHLFTADGFHGTIKECDEGDLEWIVGKVGADRVAYGSDLTAFECAHILGTILMSRLTETEKEKVLGLNAKAFFNL